MDLTQANIQLHPDWELTYSNPNHLVFKSPYIEDVTASIEIEIDGNALYGIIKSFDNPIGTKIVFGKGIALELFLILIVDMFAEDIFG